MKKLLIDVNQDECAAAGTYRYMRGGVRSKKGGVPNKKGGVPNNARVTSRIASIRRACTRRVPRALLLLRGRSARRRMFRRPQRRRRASALARTPGIRRAQRTAASRASPPALATGCAPTGQCMAGER